MHCPYCSSELEETRGGELRCKAVGAHFSQFVSQLLREFPKSSAGKERPSPQMLARFYCPACGVIMSENACATCQGFIWSKLVYEIIERNPHMGKKELEVYSGEANSAIVRMPERQFPGVLIQGDSLSILFSEAMEIVEALENSPNEKAFLVALGMARRLEGHLLHYEDTLQRAGMRLPYVRDEKRSTKRFKSRLQGDA